MKDENNQRKKESILTEIVNLTSGPIQGEKIDGVNQFLGIPYAQSIAGKNRFLPPQPIESWTEVRQTLCFAEEAPQQAEDPTAASPITPAFQSPDYVKQGDDCLDLNVWAPETGQNLPVMVWLHGGGWTSGSGSCRIYNGKNLASRGDVIIVTINHRLGALGLTDFSRVIGGEFADSSNLGIRDIIAALQWVQKNIKAVGGNPDLVTIFGESGGGWKVNTLLGVPAAKGLFHRAIVESGPLTHFLTADRADALANALLNELKISPETAGKLNDLPFETVLEAEKKVMANNSMASMMMAPGFPIGFWPSIDGTLIMDHVHNLNAESANLDVPLLIGQNGTEFTLFMLGDQGAYSLKDEESLKQRIAGIFGPELAVKLIANYKSDFPDYDYSGLWFRILSDYAMATLSSEIMDVRSDSSAAPVYAFRFDWQTPIMEGKLYSPHTIEIPFVFDNVSTEVGLIMTNGSSEAVKLAKTVSDAWVEFAKTGKPAAESLPDWPAFSKDTRASMHLDLTSNVAPYIDPEVLNIFHTMLWRQAGLS